MVKDTNTRISVTVSKDIHTSLAVDANKKGVSISQVAGDIIRDHYNS